MAGLRKLDAFIKTRPDLRSQTALGGAITLVAAACAGLLFVGQVMVYTMGNTEHSLHLAASSSVPVLPLQPTRPTDKFLAKRAGKIPINVLVTFPHINCNRLDFQHSGASLAAGEFDKSTNAEHSMRLRTPTHSELVKIYRGKSMETKPSEGCTVEGMFRAPLVAGTMGMSLNQIGWAEATSLLGFSRALHQESAMDKIAQNYNVTHFIHYVRFGQPFPGAAAKPLEDRLHLIQNNYGGIALEQVQVKLVPTLYDGFLAKQSTYQMSVVDHTVEPQTLFSHGVPHLPGLLIAYDFSPLAVHQSEGRDNFLIFLSSLISIVAGVFVTVGLVTGCLVHSAQAVAKKID